MKRILTQLLFSVLILVCGNVSAQVTNDGEPRSWSRFTGSTLAPIEMPAINLKKLTQEDQERDKIGIGPYRFGYEFDVNYSTYNSGKWDVLPNGDRIWRIRFISRGAQTMNFMFDTYYMPKGGSVYLYSYNKKELLGAYTASENQENGVLGTWLIKGDDIIIEYHEPFHVRGQGRLNIDKVIHGYRTFSDVYATKLNESGDCQVDAKCDPNTGSTNGVDWTSIRDKNMNAVARILMGGSVCTGTLVNNTNNDKKPYFLTANHCLGVPLVPDGNTSFDASSWAFGFQWYTNTPDCATTAQTTGTNAPANILSGATVKANKGSSDFALLLLNQTPPGNWNLYYAGWDKTDSETDAISSQLGVHHPKGDIMKLSRNDHTCVKDQTNVAGNLVQSWLIENWEYGKPSQGSSGSCLLDKNGRIIGQLSGGQGECSGTTPGTSSAVYGRFGIAWNEGTTPSMRLKEWLDPANTGQSTLDGGYTNALTIAEEQLTAMVSVYPNPTNGIVNVTLQGKIVKQLNYEIYNVLGQFITKGSLNQNVVNKIDLAQQKSGLYLLKIFNRDTSIAKAILLN